MATNYLDTGDTGRAVSAESDGALFAGIFGSAKYVLENGSQFKAEVQSNNIVKISDGDAVMYGRHVRIPANDSALVTINNGHSGTNRIDLIVFRYTKDSTGKETVDLVVIQGEDSTGTATAPTAVDGNILTGAMQSDFPLYSVELNGINIVKVNPLFNVIGNISKLKEELTELNSNCQKNFNNTLTEVSIGTDRSYLYYNEREAYIMISESMKKITGGNVNTNVVITLPKEFRIDVRAVQGKSAQILNSSWVPTGGLLHLGISGQDIRGRCKENHENCVIVFSAQFPRSFLKIS